ncbi:hypothetical protein SUGI_0820800 [Cryptomeria japonica]|nr:hypothetical protein SUGI_0820800 [Cryptomeria japonica]
MEENGETFKYILINLAMALVRVEPPQCKAKTLFFLPLKNNRAIAWMRRMKVIQTNNGLKSVHFIHSLFA